jgi:hypothetical protein
VLKYQRSTFSKFILVNGRIHGKCFGSVLLFPLHAVETNMCDAIYKKGNKKLEFIGMQFNKLQMDMRLIVDII